MAPSDESPAVRGPVSPGPSRWNLPDVATLNGGDLVAVGADLAPSTVLAGYRAGLFAMPEGDLLGWWSPDPRGVLRPSQVHVSRSLRRSLRRFEVSVDACFSRVLALCADPRRPGGWISADYVRTYLALHDLGWAHSVEVWQGDELAGGLFGVEVGGLFAAESKAHLVTDASKAAVVALSDLLDDGTPRIIDVQWRTEHLASLGVTELPRRQYAAVLRRALQLPPALGGQALGPDRLGSDWLGSDRSSRIRWRNG